MHWISITLFSLTFLKGWYRNNGLFKNQTGITAAIKFILDMVKS